MKKIQLLIASLLSVLFLATGCHKNYDPTSSMSANVNGAAFSSLGVRVITTGSKGTMTQVIASNLPVVGNPIPTTITINVKNVPGHYYFGSPLENKDVTVFFSSSATGGLSLYADNGSVTVTTSAEHYIQGTFSFNVLDSNGNYTISNGQFTGTY